MFEFIQLSYNEFTSILKNYKWSFSWGAFITPDYIQGCEKILDSDKNLVALIYYDTSNVPYKIGKFEVLEDLRNKGMGEKIIKQFLEIHCCNVEVIPFCEDSKRFWEKCGFVGDKYLLCYEQ